jgi:hypothetical protein
LNPILAYAIQYENTNITSYNDEYLPSKYLETVVEHEPELGKLEFCLEEVFLVHHDFIKEYN